MNCFYDCGYILKPEYEEYHDIYDIYKRIKYINNNYILLYNRIKKQFEIHNVVQPNSTLVTIWHNEVDARLEKYLFDTKVENCANNFELIEKHNADLDRKKEQKMRDKAAFFATEALNLAERKCGELTDKDFLDIKKHMKE